ncbi:MAG TPA: Mur ligase family protein, partial [Ferruginibacter sp.]|nr:Mur ligase family protein [Ferruginibacter sp.]
MYTINQIASIIKARPFPAEVDGPIEHILLDSRKLLFPGTTIFFALEGQRRKGGAFIAELYQKGVRAFVVDESFTQDERATLPGAICLQVTDVLQALHLLAAFHRQQFSIPLIGITGSNGKTMVKEWLYQLLQDDHHIVRSPKSYNSQVGVPLSVWQMNAGHSLGIFEAGISQPDEMQKLARIIDPTIGVFTSIGEAHGEGFLNIRQKINEKLKLFVNSRVLIYCADDPDMNEAVNTFKNNVRSGDDFELLSWSKKGSAALQVVEVKTASDQTSIIAQWKAEKIEFTIPFTDVASIENAITCCCVLLYLGVDAPTIAQRMQE